MSSYPPESAVEKPGSAPWAQVLVLLGGLIVILALMFLGTPATQAPAIPTPAERVFFVQPADGATVPATFDVIFGAEGLTVEPAGDIHEGAGHYHLLIDTDFIPAGEVIPKDDTHLHFGTGADRTTLTLTPGTHVLRLQFANGAHIALDGDQYRAQMMVNVEG